MTKTDGPCTTCKNYIADVECNMKDDCPVEYLKKRVRKLESDAAWDLELRSPPRGFWQ